MSKLYTVMGYKDKYKLVGDSKVSSAYVVVENISSGSVMKVHRDLVEEEPPYTVGICFGNGSIHHFITDEGSVAVNDVIVRTDVPYRARTGLVVNINTKSKQATKRLRAVVLKGREIC